MESVQVYDGSDYFPREVIAIIEENKKLKEANEILKAKNIELQSEIIDLKRAKPLIGEEPIIAQGSAWIKESNNSMFSERMKFLEKSFPQIILKT